MLPVLYPIQLDGTILEAGKNCVIIVNFGLTSYDHQRAAKELTTWFNDRQDESHAIIMTTWDQIKSKTKRLDDIVFKDLKEVHPRAQGAPVAASCDCSHTLCSLFALCWAPSVCASRPFSLWPLPRPPPGVLLELRVYRNVVQDRLVINAPGCCVSCVRLPGLRQVCHHAHGVRGCCAPGPSAGPGRRQPRCGQRAIALPAAAAEIVGRGHIEPDGKGTYSPRRRR